MTNEVILLRGLFRGCYHWGDFPTLLQSELPEKTITCIDVPGNGELSSQVSPNTIAGMVESIRSQRDQNSKVDLLAISMGGMIGLKWAELYPGEVESLICINTSVKSFSPFYERLLPQNYLKIALALASGAYRREKIIYSMVSNQKLNIGLVKKWARYADLHPMKVGNFWRQLSAANKFQVSRPTCRLYFIASAKDRLVSHKATLAMAEAWDAPVIINEAGGHDIAIDNPNWLTQRVVKILNMT